MVPTAAAAGDDYGTLVCDILIARQCGPADKIVEAGFRLQAQALIESAAVTPEAAAKTRDRGQEEYRRTWRNRGGGAVDPRCRRDGTALAERFRAYIFAD